MRGELKELKGLFVKKGQRMKRIIWGKIEVVGVVSNYIGKTGGELNRW